MKKLLNQIKKNRINLSIEKVLSQSTFYEFDDYTFAHRIKRRNGYDSLFNVTLSGRLYVYHSSFVEYGMDENITFEELKTYLNERFNKYY